jgi:hypothetical protein
MDGRHRKDVTAVDLYVANDSDTNRAWFNQGPQGFRPKLSEPFLGDEPRMSRGGIEEVSKCLG